MTQRDNYELYHRDGVGLLESMQQCSVDAIITDPPYGILKSCDIETNPDVKRFMQASFSALKPGSFLVFFGVNPMLSLWNIAALNAGFRYKETIVWHKRQPNSPMMKDMLRIHELISVFVKPRDDNKAVYFYHYRFPLTDYFFTFADFILEKTVAVTEKRLERIASNIEKIRRIIRIENGVEPVFSKAAKIQNVNSNISTNGKVKKPACTYYSEFRLAESGRKPINFFSIATHNKQCFNNDNFNIKHPTVKPLQLIEYLLHLTSTPQSVIIDPFVGSGTTIIAGLMMAEQRHVIGAEINDKYFELAKARIEKFLHNPECYSLK